MKLILGGLTAMVALMVGGAMLLGPHYFRAMKQQVTDGIIESVSPDLHAEAARQALKSAEQKLVSAMRHSQQQLEKLDEYRQQLAETETLRVDLAKRLMNAHEALAGGEMDHAAMGMISQEVSMLKSAHEEAMAREKSLRQFVDGAASKHEALKMRCEAMVAEIEGKKLALSQTVSRVQADQAEEMLDDATAIVSNLDHHPAFGREAKEILASLKTPPLQFAAESQISREMLMADIKKTLGRD